MVPGDDRAAAAEAAAVFPADRTAHFWDETRLIGRTWSAHFLPRHMEDLRRAVSDIPELAERIAAWSPDPELAPPAWDCAFFYGPGIAWAEPLPLPVAWTKQFGFWMSGDGAESGGTFWSDRSTTALVDSSWTSEMEAGMARIVTSEHGLVPSIELLGFGGCPNTRTMRSNAQEAMRVLGLSAEVSYIDQEALPANDLRRGWPAPTILVDGRDLFGLPAPSDSTPSCRMYPGGAPSVEEIAAALKAVVAGGTDRAGRSGT
jgi:hypothetical protein